MVKREPQKQIWFRCAECHISQSLGCIDFGDAFVLSCPDCHKPMVKEM